MNYTKPEVSVLGSASKLIEIVNNVKQSSFPDGSGSDPNHTPPAYDLDE
jgi:hypothetical protein